MVKIRRDKYQGLQGLKPWNRADNLTDHSPNHKMSGNTSCVLTSETKSNYTQSTYEI